MQPDFNVDLVYLWCDMSDEKWLSLRNETAKKYGVPISDETNGACRIQSHDELKYSLRSVEMYAPWVNNIFIVVDDIATLPKWLNTNNGRLNIVRHSEIIPREYLPCFSSTTMEHYIPFIKGLSEHFLYSNDDTFFGAPVTSDFFFKEDGNPIVRVFSHLPEHATDSKNYTKILINSYQLVVDEHPELSESRRKNIYRWPHHNIDAYRKSDCLETYKKYQKHMAPTFLFPFRSDNQYQRMLYLYEALVSEHAHLKILHRDVHYEIDSLDMASSYMTSIIYLCANNPSLFVLNDNALNSESDYRALGSFLELKFPFPSNFEKDEK